MDLYLDFPDIDGTPISVTELTDGNIPEKPHCHGHYQLALITKGSCRHIFKGVAALAAPGDIFLIPPHMIHCYKPPSSPGYSLRPCEVPHVTIDSEFLHGTSALVIWSQKSH